MPSEVSSVPIETYNSVADFAHYVVFDLVPMMGFCFLVLGYTIWRAYRLIVLKNKKDDANA
jgi:hypothetical protein